MCNSRSFQSNKIHGCCTVCSPFAWHISLDCLFQQATQANLDTGNATACWFATCTRMMNKGTLIAAAAAVPNQEQHKMHKDFENNPQTPTDYRCSSETLEHVLLLPANAPFLGETGLDILANIAKQQPEARRTMFEHPELVRKLLNHPGPSALQAKALDVLHLLLLDDANHTMLLRAQDDSSHVTNYLVGPWNDVEFARNRKDYMRLANHVFPTAERLQATMEICIANENNRPSATLWLRLFNLKHYPLDLLDPHLVLRLFVLCIAGSRQGIPDAFQIMARFLTHARIARCVGLLTDIVPVLFRGLQLGGAIRRDCVKALCNVAEAYASVFWDACPEHWIAVLLQSWEENKTSALHCNELSVLHALAKDRNTVSRVHNLPGALDLLLRQDDGISVREKCNILVCLAKDHTFIYANKHREAFSVMLSHLCGKDDSLALSALAFVHAVYAPNIRGTTLYPGLLSCMQAKCARSDDVEITQAYFGILTSFVSVIAYKREMVMQPGFVECLLEQAKTHPRLSVREGSLTVLLALSDASHAFDGQQLTHFWTCVLGMWAMRAPRHATRLHGTQLVQKLVVELARMVWEMLV